VTAAVAAAGVAGQWQQQLGGSEASGAAQRWHQSKILRDRELQNQKTGSRSQCLLQGETRIRGKELLQGTNAGSTFPAAARGTPIHHLSQDGVRKWDKQAN
jgi:hypothetical protein